VVLPGEWLLCSHTAAPEAHLKLLRLLGTGRRGLHTEDVGQVGLNSWAYFDLLGRLSAMHSEGKQRLLRGSKA
jgi:hypothetical protein